MPLDLRVFSRRNCAWKQAASSGTFVYIPGGTIHTFRHDGEDAGRMLTVSSPGGIEEMFMAPDAETRAAAERKLGVENIGPPLAPGS